MEFDNETEQPYHLEFRKYGFFGRCLEFDLIAPSANHENCHPLNVIELTQKPNVVESIRGIALLNLNIPSFFHLFSIYFFIESLLRAHSANYQ